MSDYVFIDVHLDTSFIHHSEKIDFRGLFGRQILRMDLVVRGITCKDWLTSMAKDSWKGAISNDSLYYLRT